MAPVATELRRRFKAEDISVISTGQHKEILEQALALFSIVPAANLALMTENQRLEDVVAETLRRLPPIFEQLRPDLVLVQGDTATAFAAALCAFYAKIPVGHVEAGLRSGDPLQPFPEEVNRKLISGIASKHFAPTTGNRDNLLREGIDPAAIVVTGNTVIDALLETASRTDLQIPEEISRLSRTSSRKIVVTAHRRENFGAPLESICAALQTLARRHSDIELVISVHPNPNAGGVVRKLLSGNPQIHLLEPLEYAPFVHLMKLAHLILTDSGGIQEEAPSLGKPVLVLRNVTERPEAVSAGTVKIVGTDTEAIVAEASKLLTDTAAYERMAQSVNPYGDGNAAKRIADELLRGI